MSIRLVFLDDHPLFRGGLRAVLDANRTFSVVGEAADGRSALELVEKQQPDVVIADVSLRAMSGIDFTREARRRSASARVLILTMHQRNELAAEAFAAGARGYALKNDSPASIIDAIHAVARGELYLSPALPKSVLEGGASDDPLRGLTVRQRSIFGLVVAGLSNADIARELNLSVKTVQTHRIRINAKLGAHSTGDLVRFASVHGLITSQ